MERNLATAKGLRRVAVCLADTGHPGFRFGCGRGNPGISTWTRGDIHFDPGGDRDTPALRHSDDYTHAHNHANPNPSTQPATLFWRLP